MGLSRRKRGTGGPSAKLRSTPLMQPYDEEDETGYSTLEEAVVHECMQWVKESENSLETSLLIRSGILHGRHSI